MTATVARRRVTKDRAGQIRAVSIVEKRLHRIVDQTLRDLGELVQPSDWRRILQLGVIPREVVEQVETRINKLGYLLVDALEASKELREQVSLTSLARMQIGELVQGLTDSQLQTLRAQLKILFEVGPSEEVLESIGKTTGLTAKQARLVEKARQMSLDTGATPAQAARVANAVREKWQRYRSTLIARTEAVRHAAQIIQARGEELQAEGRLVKRLWLSSRDEYVCPICIRNDTGEWVDLHEPFPSGHDLPPAHPGCRCVIELYVEAETPIRPARPKPGRFPAPDGAIDQPFIEDVQKFEQQAHQRTIEYCSAWDKAGSRILEKSGRSSAITFSDSESEMLVGARLFTHNHPNAGSLSIDDVLFATRHEIQEFRAVGELEPGRAVVYRMTGHNEMLESVEPREVVDAWRAITLQVEAQVRPRYESGELTSTEAHRIHSHEAVSRLAAQFGFRYERWIEGVPVP